MRHRNCIYERVTGWASKASSLSRLFDVLGGQGLLNRLKIRRGTVQCNQARVSTE